MALKQGPQERSHGDVSSGSIGSNDVPAAIVGPSRPPRSPSTKAPFYLVCEMSPGGAPLPPGQTRARMQCAVCPGVHAQAVPGPRVHLNLSWIPCATSSDQTHDLDLTGLCFADGKKPDRHRVW